MKKKNKCLIVDIVFFLTWMRWNVLKNILILIANGALRNFKETNQGHYD